MQENYHPSHKILYAKKSKNVFMEEIRCVSRTINNNFSEKLGIFPGNVPIFQGKFE